MYVGASKNISTRRCDHFSLLRKKEHYNQGLQEAYSTLGESSLTFVVVHPVENVKDLAYFEHKFIQECQEKNVRLYNTQFLLPKMRSKIPKRHIPPAVRLQRELQQNV